MIVVEWKLTTFLRQEPWLDAPPRMSGVARRSARSGDTQKPDAKTWSIPTTIHRQNLVKKGKQV